MRKNTSAIFSNLYIYAIGACVFPITILGIRSLLLHKAVELIFWITINIISDLRPIITYNKYEQKTEVTMSFALQLCAVIVLGPELAALISIISTIFVDTYTHKPLYKALFNAGQYGLALLSSGYVYRLFKLSPAGQLIDIKMDIPAILMAMLVFYCLNMVFISLVISLTSGASLAEIIHSNYKNDLGYFVTLAPISVAMAMLYRADFPFAILFMIPPVLTGYRALHRYYQLHQETQETLKLLADILDERDKYTSSHSARVAGFSRKIAKELGLSEDSIQEIELAGRVHDLGKIAIEDSILHKEGKLNPDELAKIRQHPETGYRLMKNLKLYKNAAEYVLYHHERMDGKGYPGKKQGESIPLGSRILSVADSFDAMTSNRSYRNALTRPQAVEELRHCSGTQFDPHIVDAFIDTLENNDEVKD